MTTANGINHGDDNAAQSALRRCAANVVVAIAVLARPASIHPRNPWPLAPKQLAIVAGLALVIFLLVAVLIDGAAINGVRHLPLLHLGRGEHSAQVRLRFYLGFFLAWRAVS